MSLQTNVGSHCELKLSCSKAGTSRLVCVVDVEHTLHCPLAQDSLYVYVNRIQLQLIKSKFSH